MGNTSPSVEPYRANAYRQDTLSGSHLNKNKFLDAVLRTKGLSEEELSDVWRSIISNDGSAQHLTCLTDNEKEIYKTSMEIDMRWLIEHAADRQEYIDQAQSINLFFRPDSHIKYIHSVHFLAWKKKLKTLYYCRSEKIGKADKVHRKLEREIIKEIDLTLIAQGNDCIACEG
jgi:ribonucleoside-diphosphate reductase alpha chain